MLPAAPPDASRPPVPRLTARAVVSLCGLFFLSRLLVLAVASVSYMVVTKGPEPTAGRTWIERFGGWDSNWYLDIARDGYNYHADGRSSVGFYPLYPLLMRVAGLCRLDLRLAGYAISHAALLAACVLLWKLAALETRCERTADRAVMFLLFCPGAMWFGMIYTESLFLLTQIGCLLCARRGRWVAAGLWGFAAALTRTPGLLLAGFLFLEGAQQWRERRRAPADDAPPAGDRPWLARVACGVAGPVFGQAAFLLFLQLRFGDWRAQQKTMAAGWNHGNGLIAPWTALSLQWQYVEHYLVAVSMPLLAITVGLALAGLFTLRRLGYAALVLALCVLYVSATPGDATTRYLCTAAPTYLVLAQLADRSRLLETAALVFSVGTMTLLTVLLVNGYHVI